MARLTGKYSVSTLASILAAGDDHLHVAPGEGALFPSSGDFMLRIGAGSSYEVVRATARSTDTISVTRAQDGTSAIEHAEGSTLWCLTSHTYLEEMWTVLDRIGDRPNGALTPGNANAFAIAWANPCTYAVWAEPLIDVTVAGGTAGAVMDVGAAAGATTHAEDSIDGLPIDQIISYRGNPVKVGVGEYITGQILTANAASLDGKYYCRYWPV